MKMLMKYELRNTWFLKLILLGMTAAAELVFLSGLWSNREEAMAIGVLLLVFLATAGVAVIGLGTVVVLHRDMNTKQSCMLFMTPHSSYAILGAKVIENGVSILLASAFYFALGALDITLLFAHQKVLDQLWQMVSEFLAAVNRELTFSAPMMATLVFVLASSWFNTVITACFADIVAAALLGGKRFSGLISVVLFLVLSYLQSAASGWVMSCFRLSFIPTCLIRGGIMLLLSAGMYWAAAAIMDKRLSV